MKTIFLLIIYELNSNHILHWSLKSTCDVCNNNFLSCIIFLKSTKKITNTRAKKFANYYFFNYSVLFVNYMFSLRLLLGILLI